MKIANNFPSTLFMDLDKGKKICKNILPVQHFSWPRDTSD